MKRPTLDLPAPKPLRATRQDCQACVLEPYVTAQLVVGQNVAAREPFCRADAEDLDARGLLAVGSARRVVGARP